MLSSFIADELEKLAGCKGKLKAKKSRSTPERNDAAVDGTAPNDYGAASTSRAVEDYHFGRDTGENTP